MASQTSGELLKLWMEYAAELGDYECRYRLNFEREDNDEQFWLQECAEHGVVEAQYELGMFLLEEYEENSELELSDDWDGNNVLEEELSEIEFPLDLEEPLRSLGWDIISTLGAEPLEEEELERIIEKYVPEDDSWYQGFTGSEEPFDIDDSDYESRANPIVFANLAYDLKDRLETRWREFRNKLEESAEEELELYEEAVSWIREAASHKHRKAMEWLKENIDEEE